MRRLRYQERINDVMAIEISLDAKSPTRALVMELEGMAVPTRRVIFENVRATLSEQGVSFDEPAMMRYGLHAVPAHMVGDIAEHYGLRAAARTSLLGKLNKALVEHFRSRAVTMALGLDRVLDLARDAGSSLGVLSWQEEDAARALVEKVGLARWNPQVFCLPSPDHEFPGADVWLKALKALGCSPRSAAALCSARAPGRAALAAGLRVVASPDEFTSHQDFGGVDALVDHVGDATVEQIFGRI
jgi:beta-phosphoglucomutase-like phosphatase (HAD superfamily)